VVRLQEAHRDNKRRSFSGGSDLVCRAHLQPVVRQQEWRQRGISSTAAAEHN